MRSVHHSTKHGQIDAGRRSSAEDRIPARTKGTNHAEGKGNKDAPVQERNAGRRNSSAEDRKSAGCKGKDPAEDKDPVDSTDKARGTIELMTTEGSTRRDRSLRMPTRANGMKCVDGTGQGRKGSPGKEFEKRTLFVSRTEETPE